MGCFGSNTNPTENSYCVGDTDRTEMKYSSEQTEIERIQGVKKNMQQSKIDEKKIADVDRYVFQSVSQRYTKQHNEKVKVIQERLIKLGYNEPDSNQLQLYIKQTAPVIIHFRLDQQINHFLVDTHLKNLFGKGKGRKRQRIQWENTNFNNFYKHSSDDERVKYGCLNISNDHRGVESCLKYGKSYVVLNNDVRKRCTITSKNSSQDKVVIGSLMDSFNVLSELSDSDLSSAMEAALGKPSASSPTNYVEVQVHGPIRVAKDVEKIVIGENEYRASNYQYLLKQFLKLNSNINLVQLQ